MQAVKDITDEREIPHHFKVGAKNQKRGKKRKKRDRQQVPSFGCQTPGSCAPRPLHAMRTSPRTPRAALRAPDR